MLEAEAELGLAFANSRPKWAVSNKKLKSIVLAPWGLELRLGVDVAGSTFVQLHTLVERAIGDTLFVEMAVCASPYGSRITPEEDDAFALEAWRLPWLVLLHPRRELTVDHSSSGPDALDRIHQHIHRLRNAIDANETAANETPANETPANEPAATKSAVACLSSSSMSPSSSLAELKSSSAPAPLLPPPPPLAYGFGSHSSSASGVPGHASDAICTNERRVFRHLLKIQHNEIRQTMQLVRPSLTTSSVTESKTRRQNADTLAEASHAFPNAPDPDRRGDVGGRGKRESKSGGESSGGGGGGESMGEGERKGDDARVQRVRGLFFLASFVNHSCTPNAARGIHCVSKVGDRVGDAGTLITHCAIQPMKAGDQVTVSYLGVGGDIATLDRHARQQRLQFMKPCECLLCRLSPGLAPAPTSSADVSGYIRASLRQLASAKNAAPFMDALWRNGAFDELLSYCQSPARMTGLQLLRSQKSRFRNHLAHLTIDDIERLYDAHHEL